MTIQTEIVEYTHDGKTFEGLKAWDDSMSGPRPAVLVAHAWKGRSEVDDENAKRLAELGYVGFALDLFGKGVQGQSVEENQKLIQPFLEDRGMLQDQMKTVLELARSIEDVDSRRVAAIGFCFGGLSVLDLARTGADLQGVVSFHGLFDQPDAGKAEKITAPVLILHGWDDPMAQPDDLKALADELDAAHCDWRVHAYGGTKHAFTNPNANDSDLGTVYNEKSARLAWRAMKEFLEDIFA